MTKFENGQRVKEINTGKVYTVCHANPAQVWVYETCLHFHPAKLQAC